MLGKEGTESPRYSIIMNRLDECKTEEETLKSNLQKLDIELIELESQAIDAEVYRSNLRNFLESTGDRVVTVDTPVTADSGCVAGSDFIVSYGYRHILKKDLLDKFANRAINLHISLLPWNRGADPNLWSILEDTPRGVTIHFLDNGIDTGDIIAQRTVDCLSAVDTLKSSYERLTRAIEELFMDVWPKLRVGDVEATHQASGGSFHRSKDRVAFEHLLTKGWDTPVVELIGKAANVISDEGS